MCLGGFFARQARCFGIPLVKIDLSTALRNVVYSWFGLGCYQRQCTLTLDVERCYEMHFCCTLALWRSGDRFHGGTWTHGYGTLMRQTHEEVGNVS